MTLRLSGETDLRLLREDDAVELHTLIEANRAHLAPWLTWAGSQTLDDTLAFIRAGEAQVAANDGFHTAIVLRERIVGVVSYMGVDWRNRRTVLGYWLDVGHEGQGLMTRAVRAMVDHALSVWELNRVEIRAAVENRRSRAVAERLGFAEEGTLRQAEFLGDRYHDTVIYAMLAEGWPAPEPPQ